MVEMTRSRKLLTMGAAIVALGAGAMGVPAAAGGGSGEQMAGPAVDRAERVAVELVGGGRVVGVERQGAGWKVEVVRDDPRLEPWTGETSTGRRLLVVHLDVDLEWIRIGGSL
jgi:hypothetical protein